MLNAALGYAEWGWSVIPVGRNKRPLLAWKAFQTQRADAGQIRAWWRQFPHANIGVITGRISGLVVVDVEREGVDQPFSETAATATGGGGRHYFYAAPQGVTIPNATRIPGFVAVDIRGEGGYVVVPPSRHQSGQRYRWLSSPADTPLAPFPQALVNWPRSDGNAEVAKAQRVTTGGNGERQRFHKAMSHCSMHWGFSFQAVNYEGSRNTVAARVAGMILARLSECRWEPEGWRLLVDWNLSKNVPPLAETELQAVWRSIGGRERRKRAVGCNVS